MDEMSEDRYAAMRSRSRRMLVSMRERQGGRGVGRIGCCWGGVGGKIGRGEGLGVGVCGCGRRRGRLRDTFSALWL